MSCIYYDENGTNGISNTSGYVLPKYSNSGFEYNFDIDNVLFNLLPSVYRPYKDGTTVRRVKLFKYIQVIYGQIRLVYSFFKTFRYEQLYLSNVSSSTIVLEKYLRIIYNDCAIKIKNNYTQVELTYLFRPEEQQDKEYLFRSTETIAESEKTYLYNSTELAPSTNFTVYVPAYLITSNITTEQILTTLIQSYTYPTMTFNIVQV